MPQPDGSFVIDGATAIRDINRALHWELPIDGPKTLNGLILEKLEDIPEPGVTVVITGHAIEIMQTQNRMVKVVRIRTGAEAPEAAAA